tara:strand:+ start:41139 stop:44285 length:3147 start_codon:yes stop_codon:yes gene_type:complete
MTREEIERKIGNSLSLSEFRLEYHCLLQLHDLGWECVDAEHETEHASQLGRQDLGEVVLTKYLEPRLQSLNPKAPKAALDQAVQFLVGDRSVMQTVVANREIYSSLKEGVKVTYLDNHGEQQTDRIKIIDWKKPSNNHFLIVSQMKIRGNLGNRIPDLLGFVNGIPLLFVELKAASVNIKHAYDDNLRDYKDTIPHLLAYNGFCMLSNGIEAKIGSITAGWEHFAEWKKVSSEEEEGKIDVDTLINGTCQHPRFLDIIENFIVFLEMQGGLVKIVSKNHQYLGVNNSMSAVHQLQDNQGRLGVFWHTQGSGKSISMVFFCQKVLRKVPGNWTFVIITDRTELDKQIYENFQNAGVINEAKVQARSTKGLRKLLSQDHRYIFTLIHKFQTDDGSEHPVLSDRDDIIVITDEAHRSQYDLLALNMRNALPNAAFLGFTGTPLISNEQQKTREVFGDYISIYNFSQSIEDGATVPLFYEDRIPEVQLSNKYFSNELNELIDEAGLDEAQEEKLERKFSQMYQVVTRDDRLEKVAEDLVDHYTSRGNRGKAMVISIDKSTAVRMYEKVQKYWIKYLEDFKEKITQAADKDKEALQDIYNYHSETDMAVVVSSSQNDVATVKAKGGDIRPHRERMIKEDLETKFKDADDPFRIVFVCAMWITGFDVPSCSTMYIDKPMRNHTLMQTIARANRVFKDKVNGLIVDYVGIFRHLEKALSIYGIPGGGGDDTPVKHKDELKAELILAIDQLMEYVDGLGVDIDKVRSAEDTSSRLRLFMDARDTLVQSEDVKKEFLKQANQVKRLYKAYLPNKIDKAYAERAYHFRKLVNAIRSLDPEVNIDEVMSKVDDLLDRSIIGYELPETEGDEKYYDLSQIDFATLKKKFESSRKKRTHTEGLKNSLIANITRMSQVNKTRMNYMEKLNDLIKDYNEGARTVEYVFQRLVQLAEQLKEEEKRYIREELDNEKELAMFDLLTKPEPDLSAKERKDVKAVARILYDKLVEGILTLDWRKKQEKKAEVQVAIKTILNDGLPEIYDRRIFDDKRSAIYDYVYECM